MSLLELKKEIKCTLQSKLYLIIMKVEYEHPATGHVFSGKARGVLFLGRYSKYDRHYYRINIKENLSKTLVETLYY